MTKKSARKIMRRYQNKVHTKDARWLDRLWRKCVSVLCQ
jgi:hypothetical protein